jgi:hypothetical protein
MICDPPSVLYISLFNVILTTLEVCLVVQVLQDKLISSLFVGICSYQRQWPDEGHFATLDMDKLSRISKWPKDSLSSGRHEH